MDRGDVIEYQTDSGTQTGTVVDTHGSKVSVTHIDNPQATRTIEKEQIIEAKKRRR